MRSISRTAATTSKGKTELLLLLLAVTTQSGCYRNFWDAFIMDDKSCGLPPRATSMPMAHSIHNPQFVRFSTIVVVVAAAFTPRSNAQFPADYDEVFDWDLN